MKKSLIIAAFLTVSATAFSQEQFFLTDKVSGNIYRQKDEYVNINGSPFFVEEWLPGVMYMKDGARANKFKLRFDAYNNELLFLNGNDPLVVVNPMTGFDITNFSGTTFRFRCGYPAIDKNTEKSFYQLMEEGPSASLIKLVKKTILTIEEYNKAGGTKEFNLSETYFIVKPNGTIVKIKKDKNSLLDALSDAGNGLANWVEKKRLRCKTEEELMEVVKAYNDKTYQ